MSETTPGYITPDSPTTCSLCGARLYWDGDGWEPADVEALVREARAQALEDAALMFGYLPTTPTKVKGWLRARAKDIRDGAE
jgi:hypothetical protein